MRRGLAQVHRRLLQHGDDAGQARVEFHQALQLADALGKRCADAGAAVAAVAAVTVTAPATVAGPQSRCHRGRRIRQILRVVHAFLLRLQLRPFVGERREFLQFRGLESQQIGALLQHAAALVQAVNRRAHFNEFFVVRRELRQRPGVAGGAVQQRQLAVPPQQTVVFVLAVDVDQFRAQGAQLRGRDRAPVDESAAGFVAPHLAPQDAFGVAVEGVVAQPLQRRVTVAERESALHFGALLTAANHAVVAAPAEQHADRLDNQRFAGAGLAGDGGERVAELQLQTLGDCQLADLQVLNHSFQPSLERRVSKWL